MTRGMLETMANVSQAKFEEYIAEALDRLPERYQKNLQNVVIVAEDLPTSEQLQKQGLPDQVTLLGLYEGIPLTRRGSNYSGVLPDKISIFKIPHEVNSRSEEQLRDMVHHTVWHEVAHYYGLSHFDIDKLD
jgi:predicted Zn-dependent protease with MMP-like domain